MNKLNLIFVSIVFVLLGCKDQQPVAQGPKFWGPNADDIQVFVNIKENNFFMGLNLNKNKFFPKEIFLKTEVQHNNIESHYLQILTFPLSKRYMQQ